MGFTKTNEGIIMIVTVKFKLDHTWDEYKDINTELLL